MICQPDNGTGEVHPILSPMSKTASKGTTFDIDLPAFVCVISQVVYVTLMILGRTVNCRF